MKSLFFKTSIIVGTLCLLFSNAVANDSDEYSDQLEISGFMDITSSYNHVGSDKTDQSLGQVELGFARQINPKSNLELAVYYNNESSQIELGTAIVMYHLFQKDSDSKNNYLLGVTGIDFVAGQFDVPFGIYVNEYASPDRTLISEPLVVHLTHDSWGDVGLQLQLQSELGNLVIYGVNGFESSASIHDEVASLTAGYDVFEEVDTTPANAFGGRLGVVPSSLIEIGTSFSVGFNKSGEDEMVLAGVDASIDFSLFKVKGEYITHSLNRSIAQENNRGYYIETVYNLASNIFLAGRYGSFKHDNFDWYQHSSLGAGYIVAEGFELRFESTLNDDSSENQNILQLVASF